MSDPRPEEELADRVADLETALRDLRSELVRAPRGPMGMPRPPSPREVLRFTGEYAIPATIAILEANVRVLELLQRVIRAADVGTEASERGGSARRRAVSLSRESLARLDRTLSELSVALEEGDLPRNAEARNLLEEVRGFNDEVRERLERTVPDEGGPSGLDGTDELAVEIDIEDELDAIRREVENEGEGEDDGDETGPEDDGDREG